MEQIPLSASLREGTGKGVARKLRAAGQIPAVLYGAGNQPQPLTLTLMDLSKVLRQVSGENAFLALSVDQGPARMAVLHEMQHDYLGKRVLHVDLMEVKAGQSLTMDVPLEFVGEAPGVNLGGVLNQAYHSVKLEGQIKDLPEVVRVDLSGLGLGAAIHLADLQLPDGVKAVFDENDAVVTCAEPSASAPAEVEAAEAAE